tara:strand:+ start:45 stop:251 length:207 start_codon:yes stop_codon:yes gene_type:complete
MKNYFVKIVMHPVTHFNVISLGVLILIGVLHNHAHYAMSMDADSYVRQWCKSSAENKKTCIRYGRDNY